jgi:hypothetical protein
MRAGIRYEVSPIPMVAEHTTFVPAGPVTFGVEYRILTDDLLDAAYVDDAAGAEVINGARPESVDDAGVSIHVIDADKDVELIRFDCFDDDPHYHYILPAEAAQQYVHFDTAAHGEMLPWALSALEDRLPDMLRAADAASLAERLDAHEVSVAVKEVTRLSQDAAGAGRSIGDAQPA